jgi:hypothetical protein
MRRFQNYGLDWQHRATVATTYNQEANYFGRLMCDSLNYWGSSWCKSIISISLLLLGRLLVTFTIKDKGGRNNHIESFGHGAT